ncbi:hypothetical protein ABT297_40070 [Dactylosporangium sp. NPDC000555]|uniref:hypothetical protein n=1 Tax=Dactylosporangium sp. NPDC000555 TaxID=3154260 RepID=UPI003323AC40
MTLVYLIFRQLLAWLALLARSDTAMTAEVLLDLLLEQRAYRTPVGAELATVCLPRTASVLVRGHLGSEASTLSRLRASFLAHRC